MEEPDFKTSVRHRAIYEHVKGKKISFDEFSILCDDVFLALKSRADELRNERKLRGVKRYNANINRLSPSSKKKTYESWIKYGFIFPSS